jgi:ferredoxin
MAVTILLQKPDGSHIATFVAEDKQSIAQLAKKNGVDFPISCGIGLC